MIAKIKLAPGRAGWFDPASGIHLTIASPYGEVKSGMNVTAIKRGLEYGTIVLVEGYIDPPAAPTVDEVIHTISKVEQEVVQTESVEVAIEEISEVVEEVIEETSEVVEEAPKAKKTKKKVK